MARWARVLRDTGREYCDRTSLHGFAYWVNSKKFLEVLFWVAVVTFGVVRMISFQPTWL